MFKTIFSIFAVISCVGCASIDNQKTLKNQLPESAKPVMAAAFGDSLTTHVGIASGTIRETNPLINTSPLGLAGLFLIKTSVIYALDKQPPHIREPGLKINNGMWTGASVNNLLLIAGATNPLSLAGGALAGIGAYYYQENLLEKEKLYGKTSVLTESVSTLHTYSQVKGDPKIIITKKYMDKYGVASLVTTKKIY